MLLEANPLPLGSSRLVCIPGVGSALLTWERVEPMFRRVLIQDTLFPFFSGFHNFNASGICNCSFYIYFITTCFMIINVNGVHCSQFEQNRNRLFPTTTEKIITILVFFLSFFLFAYFFKDLFIYLFILERKEGRQKDRERNSNVRLPLSHATTPSPWVPGPQPRHVP